MTDRTLESVEGVVLTILVVSGVLWFLIARLKRARPELRIGGAVAVAVGLRLLAIAAINATGLNSVLRGGDETGFIALARTLAQQPLGHGDFPHGPYQLHTVVFALQLKLGFLTLGALRITQVGLAWLGVILVIASVHDLAGPRAARLAAWVLAFEPTSIFFNSALHKEPLMELASGLVAFGGTMIWRRLDVRGILLCALGGAIAVETRSYAGWFLVASVVLLLMHAALRGLDRPMRAMPLIYGVAIVAFVATPTLLQASSTKSLQSLQISQNANTTGVGPATGTANGNNLALETVDFSTRGAIITNLPKRIRDLLLRPFVWQLGDNSQRFGAIGTMIAYTIFFLLIRYAWLSRGQIFPRAGPLLYPLFFLLIAYSLSVGNAGTGFRYRSHLVTLAIAAMAILREESSSARARARVPSADPAARAASGIRTSVPSGV